MADFLSTDYFELFDIPVSYDVDLDTVQQRYRELQKAVHPDKFANASSQERRISMQQTSMINQALSTLKHPVDRAMYLLKLKGLDFSMDNETTMDAGFLMEQMEMREQLESVRNTDDPLATLDTMLADVKSNTAVLEAEFKRAFESDDLETAREVVRKMQFMYKARKEIDDMTATFEDELI